MKQVAQNYKSGELAVLDVPPPGCAPGGVLVRSLYSLISTGTELMKVGEAKLSLVGKAKARPDQVRKVLDTVAQQGVMSTYKKVMNKLDSYTPLGYSLCGVVVEVGAGAEEFSVGQMVAAAGNEYALHAEYNWVPLNLCVPVPDGVPAEQAAFSTVGAIAMQGVRQAEVQLGDTAVVIGLGLVGQLVVRLLVAAGVRVWGIDTVADRCRMAEKAGALACASPDEVDALERSLLQASNGLGADHILLAAGGHSNGPVETAARLARDRARVVDIGKTKLDLPWNAYYDKELDVRFSRSYGPGRYDDRYELQGIDYPAGYVRWTERRNLECFVDLIAREQIDVGSLIANTFPIADATDVYQKLSAGTYPGVGFLFEYPKEEEDTTPGAGTTSDAGATAGSGAAARNGATAGAATSVGLGDSRRREPAGRPAPAGAVRVGFVGAGNYASSMLLPHLQKDQGTVLGRVATNKSLSAANAQRRFGFEAVSTNADEVLHDDSLDAVFVVTRHSSHAELACRALETGKAVFVEKPLALTDDELDRIVATVDSTGNDRLMVGFNRRFAPLLTDLKTRFGTPGGNSSVRYLVNAGKLDSTSWYLDAGKEGSRFAGEGGHFIDTLTWWLNSLPTEVYAVPGPDTGDVLVTLRFANGSVGTIAYVGGGNARFPKETIDITGGGRNARFDNFQAASVWTGRKPATRKSRSTDKGQRTELERFVAAVKSGGPMPIPFEHLVATTRATIAVDRSLASGKAESILPPPHRPGQGTV